MGSKKATSSSESQQTYTPRGEALNQYNQIFTELNDVSNRPYQAYQGPLSDPGNAWHEQGAKGLATGYGLAAQAPHQIAELQNRGRDVYSNIQAASGVYQPYYDDARSYTGLGAAAVRPTEFTSAELDKYMSPYLSKVVDSTMANIRENDSIQQNRIISDAIKQGNAFGGDRMGLAQANLARSQNLASGQTISNLMNQGFSQALGQFNNQQAINLQAAQNNAARALQAGAQMGQLGTGAQEAALSGSRTALQSLAADAQLSGLQNSAAQNVANIGSQMANFGEVQRKTQQDHLDRLYQQYQLEQAFPYQQLAYQAGLAGQIGPLMGGSTTGMANSSQPTGGNPIGQAIGLGTAVLGMFSDERVKENIRQVGETFDGQPVYAYNYKGEPQTQMGLIAQDVEQTHPDAVFEVDGVKAVDYDRATDRAAGLGAAAIMPEVPAYARGGQIVPSEMYGGLSFIPQIQGGPRSPIQPSGGMQAPQQQQDQGVSTEQMQKFGSALTKAGTNLFGEGGLFSGGGNGGFDLGLAGSLYAAGGVVDDEELIGMIPYGDDRATGDPVGLSAAVTDPSPARAGTGLAAADLAAGEFNPGGLSPDMKTLPRAPSALSKARVQTDREGNAIAPKTGQRTSPAPQDNLDGEPSQPLGLVPQGDVPESYLSRARAQESGGNDLAKAPTSSAFGRYQFIDSTWKGLVNSPEGRQAGLTLDGRSDPAQQEAAMRIFTAQNTGVLKSRGIQPTQGNLYMTHFLGAAGGPRMIEALRTDPNAPAFAHADPDAVNANKSVFFNADGTPRTVAQLYAKQTARFGGEGGQGGQSGNMATAFAPSPAPQQRSLIQRVLSGISPLASTATAPGSQQDQTGGGSFIERLFGGGGGLSSDQRAALLAAGLGMMASRNRSLLGTIGEGGMAGLAAYQAGAAGRQALSKEQAELERLKATTALTNTQIDQIRAEQARKERDRELLANIGKTPSAPASGVPAVPAVPAIPNPSATPDTVVMPETGGRPKPVLPARDPSLWGTPTPESELPSQASSGAPNAERPPAASAAAPKANPQQVAGPVPAGSGQNVPQSVSTRTERIKQIDEALRLPLSDDMRKTLLDERKAMAPDISTVTRPDGSIIGFEKSDPTRTFSIAPPPEGEIARNSRDRKAQAEAQGLDVNSPMVKNWILTGEMKDPARDKRPDNIEQYEFYVQQEKAEGRKPKSFENWDLLRRREGSGAESNENAFRKKMQELDAKRFTEIAEDGMKAMDDVKNLDQVQTLIGQIGTGPGVEIQRRLADFGIKVGDNVDKVEALGALLNRLTPAQRPAGAGATSDFDAKMYRDSLPRLLNTPGGNAIIVDTMNQLIQNRLARAEIVGLLSSGEIDSKEANRRLLAMGREAFAISKRVAEAAKPKGADGTTPSGPTKAAPPAIPPAAIDKLKSNDTPEMRRYFDQTFGAGAASRALGG